MSAENPNTDIRVHVPALDNLVDIVNNDSQAEIWTKWIGDGIAPIFTDPTELEGARKAFTHEPIDPISSDPLELQSAKGRKQCA